MYKDFCDKCKEVVAEGFEKIERDSYARGKVLGYHTGYMDGSKETATKIINKLEQLNCCIKQVALNELIRSLEKQFVGGVNDDE